MYPFCIVILGIIEQIEENYGLRIRCVIHYLRVLKLVHFIMHNLDK